MTGLPPPLVLAGRRIGRGEPCFLIAEAGLNHNGDVALAKRLIDVAADAGADAVKFQKRTVATLAIKRVLEAADARFPAFGSTYGQIRERLEFGWDEYVALKRHAEARGLVFFCTAFDIDAAEFLDRLGVAAFKLASHSLTNLPLLTDVAARGKPVVLSTGMSTLEEIDEAVGIFQHHRTPLVLMHCVSSYPQAPEESNLLMLRQLADRYGVPVGYSGHEIGYLPTLASIPLGAVAVERHITVDRSLEGFDHGLSLEPSELKDMIVAIRTIERALGDGRKAVSERELVTRRKYHVSIVTTTDIAAGATITPSMLTLKNPGVGLPARQIPDVVGRRVKVFIPADTILSLEMLEEGDQL